MLGCRMGRLTQEYDVIQNDLLRKPIEDSFRWAVDRTAGVINEGIPQEVNMSLKPYQIHVTQEVIDDLEYRLSNVRWPGELNNQNWNRGTDSNYLKSLVEYWKDHYDWRLQESILNKFPQYLCNIDGVNIHFIYKKGNGKKPIPIILTHGWPDSFLRYQKVISLLTDPVSNGADIDDCFDIIIPSLPGFGFSDFPKDKIINNYSVSELWNKLMTKELGYKKYAAAGGDIGSGVTRYLALNHPDQLIGIHLTDIGIIRDLLSNTTDIPLTEEELEYKKIAQKWIAQEGAYMSVHATKPQTLSYSLSDSPVGLAAWIIEKFRSWSDCGGNLDSLFSKDEIINNIMMYWISNTIGSSINMYYENTHSLPEMKSISVPTGITLFPNDILLPPRKWAEKNLNVTHWEVMERGGHFPAMEYPDSFVSDIRKFFRNYR